MNPKTAEELLEMGVGSFLVRELNKKILGAMTTLNLPLVVFL